MNKFIFLILSEPNGVNTIVKWGASFRWSSSLCCSMRNSDEMTTGKMHPTLYFEPLKWKLSWTLYIQPSKIKPFSDVFQINLGDPLTLQDS